MATELSDDPGGYLCEFIYHRILEAAGPRAIPALFLHLPPLQKADLETQRRAVCAVLDALRHEVRSPGARAG